MKNIKVYALVILLLSSPIANAQIPESMQRKQLQFQSIIVPTVLITGAMLITKSTFEQDFQDFLLSGIREDFHTDVDDYLQYAPIAELYIADLFGARSKNHWFDQTKYLLISNLITAGITHGLKYLTMKERPNGDPYAFPSGHTSLAFDNATVLLREFSETSPVLAYSGYAFAAGTGVLRMLNNKHWLSDVLAGAGIGILVTELVYYFEPFRSFNPFKDTRSVSFVPKLSGNEYGFYFAYRF